MSTDGLDECVLSWRLFTLLCDLLTLFEKLRSCLAFSRSRVQANAAGPLMTHAHFTDAIQRIAFVAAANLDSSILKRQVCVHSVDSVFQRFR